MLLSHSPLEGQRKVILLKTPHQRSAGGPFYNLTVSLCNLCLSALLLTLNSMKGGTVSVGSLVYEMAIALQHHQNTQQ